MWVTQGQREDQFSVSYMYQKDREGNVFHLNMILKFLFDVHFKVSSRKLKREVNGRNLFGTWQYQMSIEVISSSGNIDTRVYRRRANGVKLRLISGQRNKSSGERMRWKD